MTALDEARSVVVTGAGRGMGAEVARHLCGQGWRVLVADLDGGAARSVAEELASEGTALACCVDVTDPDAVAAMVQTAYDTHGGVDALVNAAGAFRPPVPTDDLPVDVWELVVGTNLTGSFLTIRAVLPYMRMSGRGSIVNFASNAARATATSLGVEYTAAKTGVLGLTRHVAREVGRAGIRVNAVAPGPVRGDRLAALEDEERLAAIADSIPLGRLGEARDVAQVVEFLLSERASFITGATVDVNGGIVMA